MRLSRMRIAPIHQGYSQTGINCVKKPYSTTLQQSKFDTVSFGQLKKEKTPSSSTMLLSMMSDIESMQAAYTDLDYCENIIDSFIAEMDETEPWANVTNQDLFIAQSKISKIKKDIHQNLTKSNELYNRLMGNMTDIQNDPDSMDIYLKHTKKILSLPAIKAEMAKAEASYSNEEELMNVLYDVQIAIQDRPEVAKLVDKMWDKIFNQPKNIEKIVAVQKLISKMATVSDSQFNDIAENLVQIRQEKIQANATPHHSFMFRN